MASLVGLSIFEFSPNIAGAEFSPAPTIDPITEVSKAALARDATAQVKKPCAVSRKYTSSECTDSHLVLNLPAK